MGFKRVQRKRYVSSAPLFAESHKRNQYERILRAREDVPMHVSEPERIPTVSNANQLWIARTRVFQLGFPGTLGFRQHSPGVPLEVINATNDSTF